MEKNVVKWERDGRNGMEGKDEMERQETQRSRGWGGRSETLRVPLTHSAVREQGQASGTPQI